MENLARVGGRISFSAQVRGYIENNIKRGPLIEHASTPAVLRMLGFPAVPLGMAPTVLLKMLNGKGGTRAPLTQRQIEQIPEHIDEAVAVYQHTQNASMIVLTCCCDGTRNPIVICVRPDMPYGLRRINLITTGFGKDNAQEWVAKQTDSLLYVGEKTNPRLTLPSPIYHQTGALETEGLVKIVRGPHDLRKFKLSCSFT